MKNQISELRKKASNVGEILYIIAFLVILAVDYISATSIQVTLSGRMIQLAILILGVKVLLDWHSRKEWFVIIVLAAISVISFYFTKSYFACELSLLLTASKNIDLRKLIKTYILFVGILTISVGFFAITGIFGEVAQTSDFRNEGIMTRYCMGYNHPNSYHIILLQLFLCFTWLYWEKLRSYHLIFAGVLNGILTLFTQSRTNFLLGTLVICLMVFGKIYPVITRNKKIYLVNYVGLAMSILLSGWAVLIGAKPEPLAIMDRLWTNRISYAHETAYYSRLSFFSGKQLQISCDFGFVKSLYNYGIIIYVLLLILIIYTIFVNCRKQDYIGFLCIFAGIILMLGEKFSSGEFITRNILLIFAIGYISCVERNVDT